MRVAVDARKLTDFGIGTYLAALIGGLAVRDDVELVVLVRPQHEDRAAALAPTARVLTCAAREYSVAEHVQLPAALWRERFDLVHFPHYVVPLLLPRPIVVTVHDVIQLFYPPRQRHQLALLYLRLSMRSALRRARRVITVSRASRRDLIELFGADARRLVVIPNGVDEALAQRPAGDRLEELKQVYELRPPLVLVVANDKPHKNLDVVLRAFQLARRRHRLPGQLVFVGGPGADHRLADRARVLGLDDRVRCLGRIPADDLHALYHLAAVLLHVALYEGFGLPVLEAMRSGLPVITSNLGAMREVGVGSARLVNPLDVSEVADALGTVLVDDPLRRRMVEAGRRRAEELTWTRTVDSTVDAYRQAIGEV
jgi:alpha-1,3-rhamnosyl/mannosyltransferase